MIGTEGCNRHWQEAVGPVLKSARNCCCTKNRLDRCQPHRVAQVVHRSISHAQQFVESMLLSEHILTQIAWYSACRAFQQFAIF